MSGKTIDSNAMAGMFTELSDRDRRQKRTILRLIAMLLMTVITIGVASCDNADLRKALAQKETVITDQGKTILEKQAQITKLEKQAAAIKAEATKAEATKTSRGTDRTATITAYTWTGNRTASGKWPKEGRTVAGPSWIPFGTRVYIDDIGWRIVEDRTAEKYDGRYDVYMDDYGRCIALGRQKKVVKFE